MDNTDVLAKIYLLNHGVEYDLDSPIDLPVLFDNDEFVEFHQFWFNILKSYNG